jgi:hypothetical protein
MLNLAVKFDALLTHRLVPHLRARSGSHPRLLQDDKAASLFIPKRTTRFSSGWKGAVPVLTIGTKREHYLGSSPIPEPVMSQSVPNPQADADRLEAAADEAIAVCGGDVRAALKALIVANEYLESEVSELMKAVSRAYVRGRFHTYSG